MEQLTLELEKPTGVVLEDVTTSELYSELHRRELQNLSAGRIRFPADIYPHVKPWAAEEQEHFLMLALDGQHAVIDVPVVVSVGLINRAVVHPREIFRPAIRMGAAAIIIAHNHPSGNSEPSPEDREVTAKIDEAGKIVGIRLLDHVVFTTTGYYSFLENNDLG